MLFIRVDAPLPVRPAKFPINNIEILLSLETMSSEEFDNMVNFI